MWEKFDLCCLHKAVSQNMNIYACWNKRIAVIKIKGTPSIIDYCSVLFAAYRLMHV